MKHHSQSLGLIFFLVCTAFLGVSAQALYLADAANAGAFSAATFNFSQLLRQKSDPDGYSLALLDGALIPASLGKADAGASHKEFKPVEQWINPSVFNEESEKTVSLNNLSDSGIVCYLIQLKSKKGMTAAERFTNRLSGTQDRVKAGSTYDSSMLLLPLEKKGSKAFAYLLGRWQWLVNPHTVVPEWGLRLASSGAIFSDGKTKSLMAKNMISANPTVQNATKQQLDTIESFGLDVGIDGLKAIRILPLYCLNSDAQRIIRGGNYFKLFLPEAPEETNGDTLNSLLKMATYLYDVYRNNHAIHHQLRAFLDEELADRALIEPLTKILEEMLSKKKASHNTVFPAHIIWKRYGPGALFSFGGSPNNKDVLTVLWDQKPTLDSLVAITKGSKAKEVFSERLGSIIYTLSFEYKEKFY